MPRESRGANFGRFPMLLIALAFCAGILVGHLQPIGRACPAIGAAVAGFAALFVRARLAGTSLMIAAFVFAGVFSITTETQSVRSDRVRSLIDSGTVPTGVPIEIEGVLARPPELAPDGFSLAVNVEKIHQGSDLLTASGRVRLFMQADPNEAAGLSYGSRVRTSAKLRRDDQFLNPGVIGQREVLDQLQLDAFGSIRAASAIEGVDDREGFSIAALVYGQRTRAIDVIRRNLSSKAAGVMIASLLGNDQFLDKETADLFREGGTYHLLVISGLHITVIGGLILFILRRLSRNRWVHFAVTSAFLWSYAIAVGGESPVMRAALMFTVLLLGYAVRRDANSLNLLGMTALILLVLRPSNLLSPSFQLTFVSVGSMFAIVVPLLGVLREIGAWTPTPEHPFPPNVSRPVRAMCEWLYWDPAAWRDAHRANIWTGTLHKRTSAAGLVGTVGQRVIVHTFEILAASTILQIALLPLSVLYFHRISAVAVFNNVWAGVAIGAESIATVLGLLISAVSESVAAGFFGLAEIFNRLLFLISAAERVGWLSFRVPEYSGYGRIFYILVPVTLVGLAIILNRWTPFELRRQSRAELWAAGVFGAILTISVGAAVFHPFSSPRPNGNLRVDFLDVGQGDSALVTFPNGETMLIDAGGSPEFREEKENDRFQADRRGIGETVVSEYLWHRGYSEVDYVLASHSDGDHIGGMADVVKNFAVGRAIFGGVDHTTAAEQMLAMIKKRGVPSEVMAAGDHFEIAGVAVDVLNPPGDSLIGRSSTNNSSLVLRFTFGGRVLLMTGDIEEGVERRLLATPEALKADVVKVAHHGSRTSSTPAFVSAVRPELAVISVGRRSPYGHPHSSVLENWQNVGAEILTTGERGTVTVVTDGKMLDVSTFLR